MPFLFLGAKKGLLYYYSSYSISLHDPGEYSIAASSLTVAAKLGSNP